MPLAHQMRIAVARRTIADLVVGLRVAEEPVSRQSRRRAPMPPSTIFRVAAIVNPCLPERLGEIGKRSEIRIVAGALAGQNCMQSVMEIIAPLRLDPVAANCSWPHDSGVVQIA